MAKQFFAVENINVGEVKQSILTEAQFQSLYGDTWVLMDGRDITGSDLATVTGNTTLPDARGIFLRGKNNGRSDGNENPAGELAEGTYEADEFGSHFHRVSRENDVPGLQYHTARAFRGAYSTSGSGSTTDTVGGNETRPKNITVNTFVKINR